MYIYFNQTLGLSFQMNRYNIPMVQVVIHHEAI